jgi:nucleoporin NUP2
MKASGASTDDGSSSKTSPFSFGTPLVPKSPETTPEAGERDGTATPAEDDETDSAKLLPTRVHDAEGEGEEDEDTTHSVRTKVYKLNKSKGESSWVDMGIGGSRNIQRMQLIE